jgi:outer membrane cobalamin receptor
MKKTHHHTVVLAALVAALSHALVSAQDSSEAGTPTPVLDAGLPARGADTQLDTTTLSEPASADDGATGGSVDAGAEFDAGPVVAQQDAAAASTDDASPHEALDAADALPALLPPDTGAPSEAIEVTVRSRSHVDMLRRSALAIGVVDLTEAKRSAADLGEALARVEGVAVRRMGGLGSDQRFSLAGLEGEQVRFFLDGIPLELSGYPFGVANVPVTSVERVEIYRGVVPVTLGADALGGAVNLITATPKTRTRGSVSYQAGSFDTHRATFDASTWQKWLFVKASGFADYSANDYSVTVDEATADGRPVRVRVRRFHDAYRALGARLSLGTLDQPWARRLLVHGFITDYDRELQHDALMNKVAGEATAAGKSAGTLVHYQNTWRDTFELDAQLGYSYSPTRFRDLTTCIYNWFGQCTQSPIRSELGGSQSGVVNAPINSLLVQHAVFLRANARYLLPAGQWLRLSLAPTHYDRRGEDRYQPIAGARDPLDVERRLSQAVIGLEYGASTFADHLELSAFGKSYLQWLRSEELLRNGEDSVRRDRDTQRFGAGAALRYAFLEPLWAKASYEYATRLPNVYEVFGNGVMIEPNLELKPELSHNANLSLTTDVSHARAGRFNGELSWFMRDAQQLIYLVGQNVYRHQNVWNARSLGGTASAAWTMVREYLWLSANATYQAFRNTSEQGAQARFNGDRMPNQPYLFANASTRAQLKSAFAPEDTLSLTWTARYTHSFFRAWESAGRRSTKDVIPTQIVHSVVLTYVAARRRNTTLSTSLEVQNVTDAAVFDFFGVQKPGRAVFAKMVAEL